MGDPLKILIVEDEPTDAELEERELRRAGLRFESRRVETRDDFLRELERFEPDLVLSDYRMPEFDGLTALKIARQERPRIPFIIVTGSLNEETAVGCIKAGADDYILKDRLARLAPSIEGALEKYRVQAEAAEAERALRDSEARYRHLFERNLAGVYRSTTNGRVLDCNEAFARIFGFDSREDVMKSSADRFYPRASERRSFVERLKNERTLKNVESEGRRKDGRPVWVLENVSLVTDDPKGEEVLEGTVVDITERKRAEADRERLVAAIEQSHDTIMMTDPEGIITYVNPAFERTTGYAVEEALGRTPMIIQSDVHEEAFHEDLWGTIRSGKVWSGEVVNRKKDGTLFTEQVVISPVRDSSGTITGFVAAQRDITQELQLRRRLEEAQNLETIGMIAGGVAHEVRNPLFAISTIVTALEKKLRGQPEFAEYMAHIQDQSHRLNALMNDLLELGKPLSEEQQEVCRLSEIVDRTLALLEDSTPGARASCICSTSDGAIKVRAIPERLAQATLNLIANALSFSPEDRPVKIELRANRSFGILSVRDEGPGIREDILPKLFRPFQTGRKEGTGLGLAIVKKTVTAFGGQVTGANNDPGPGATFTIKLPLARD